VALHASLAQLPERMAQVFILREVDELPTEEICGLLNISAPNFWTMLHRARMALRAGLEERYFQGKGGAKL
jgi:RNA polymerase sigma-70 factor (ECF subfamily)